MAEGKVVILNDENFETEVINSRQPVLVDFWAQWCLPCKLIAPIVEELALDFNGDVKIAKLNIDDAEVVVSKYKIMSIPTLVLFKNGEIVEKIVGLRNKKELADFINENK